MKDRQDSIAARIAGTITGGVRRRQQDRTPHAFVYGANGEPHVVPAGSEDQVALIESAERLVDAALAGETEPADAEPPGATEPPAADDPPDQA